MTALPKRFFTPQEYPELEAKAEYKSQYLAGEIFATAGAQSERVEIVDKITHALRTRFRRRPCRSYATDLRVGVAPGEMYTYPDISVLCGAPSFDHSYRPPDPLNPQVLFDVLSPSTEAFDRGDKFRRYRLLESLTDYVLVASEQMRVERFARQTDGSWRSTDYHQPGHPVTLASVGCELSLAEIYERVAFPELLGGGSRAVGFSRIQTAAREDANRLAMELPKHLLRVAGAILAMALLFVSSGCTKDNNSGSNAPANATYGTGQALPHPPSAGVGPQNAGPAGSQ